MPNQDLPTELLEHIFRYLKPSLGPGRRSRREHALLRYTLLSCMFVSRTCRDLTEPLLYHTITSGQLNSAMQKEIVGVERCCQVAKIVRVLYADYNDTQTMIDFHNRPSLPIVTFQAGNCANLQALVLSSSIYPRRVLPSRLLRDRNTLAPGWPAGPEIRLANLCRFEIRPMEYLRDDLDFASDGWFLLLARLPRMQNISVPTITEQAVVLPPQEQAPQQEQPPDLTSLDLTSQPMTPGLLEAILKAFPNLEELSVTWPEKGRIPPSTADLWPQLSQVLNEHGLSLRKIHFECKRTPRGLLVNLNHLHDLQSLALPIEAVMIEPAGRYRVQTTTGNAGCELFGPHGPGEGVDTFTIPLHYLLPPNLRCLTITDDWNWWADAYRLDNQLRDLMANPTFSELRSIRLRRRRPFIQLGGLGWFGYSPDRDWQVMRRTQRARQIL